MGNRHAINNEGKNRSKMLISHQATYLTVLSRYNWGPWAWATAMALAMNLTLFAVMPYLLHQPSANSEDVPPAPHINVVHMNRPDTMVRRKPVKPPEPPKKRNERPPKPVARPSLQAQLTLPQALNPRLPGGPTALVLPPTQTPDLNAQTIQAPFGIGDLDGPLTALGRIGPVYPMRAKRRGIQGWVKVKFVVNEQGAVESITLVDAKPAGIFDQSVKRCVSKWRFKPGTVGGRPVKTWAETTIKFELE